MFENNINFLQQELLEEKAASYFRITKKMKAALAALRDLDRQITEMESPPPDWVRRRESLLEDAAELVWFFIVQRESIGFQAYDSLFEDYEIPPEVRERMGPKKATTPPA